MLAVSILLLLLMACATPQPQGEFAIFLVDQDIQPAEIKNTDLDNLTLSPTPLISTADILTYDGETHQIELTQDAFERVTSLYTLPVDVDGIPFVVAVGSQPIYSGAFFTPLSSLSFDGVIILQPFTQETNTIALSLGYPSWEAFTGLDPRTDPRILSALRESGKLRIELH